MHIHPKNKRNSWLKTVAILALAMVSLPQIAMAWSAADDEANRQRMMSDMRSSAAASDRRNQASLQASQDSHNRNYGSNSSSNGGSTNSSYGGSSGGFSPYSVPESWVDKGPKPIIATYHFTIHVQESEAQAITRIGVEAKAGNRQSQYNLGRIYYTGFASTPRDDTKARYWFGEAAKQNHPPAQAQYAAMTYNGQGGPIDKVTAMKYAQLASDQNEPYGNAMLGFYIIQTASNYDAPQPKAIALLVKSAEQGQLLAQATLGGLVYYMGTNGEAIDGVKAAKYLKMASAQNHAMSMDLLGNLYMNGMKGVAANHEEGLKWLKLAAEHGDNEAMLNIGTMYLQGSYGFPKDTQKGLKLIRSAAINKYKDAMSFYALILYEGALVTKDHDDAFYYAKLAAEAGDVPAQVMLGKLYYFGHGTAKNVVETARWFRKAAENGSAEAKGYLEEPDIKEAAKSL